MQMSTAAGNSTWEWTEDAQARANHRVPAGCGAEPDGAGLCGGNVQMCDVKGVSAAWRIWRG